MPRKKFDDGAWRMDAPLYRDEETGLPTAMGPYHLFKGVDGWQVWNMGDDKVPWPIKDGYADIWEAFNALVGFYRNWHSRLPKPVVYFIGTELRRGCEIKIGHTRNLKSRLASLQTAHPKPLQVFATVPGGKKVEEGYHQRWRARRCGGEWFMVGDCIIKEIERINAATPA